LSARPPAREFISHKNRCSPGRRNKSKQAAAAAAAVVASKPAIQPASAGAKLLARLFVALD